MNRKMAHVVKVKCFCIISISELTSVPAVSWCCSCLHHFRLYLECEHTHSFTHTLPISAKPSLSLCFTHTHARSSSLLTYTLVLTPTPFFLSLFLGYGGIRAASCPPALLSSFPSYPTVPSSLSHPPSLSPAWPLKLIF